MNKILKRSMLFEMMRMREVEYRIKQEEFVDEKI